MFSAELPVLFYRVQVSGYLGTLEKSEKIIYKISVPEASTRPKEGHRAARGVPGGLLAPPLGRAGGPPGRVPHPLVPYLAPYFYPSRVNSRTEVLFPIYAVEPPPPSVLPRES